MELTVYRQSSKQRPDGTIVYKGEDARPFVDDQIFFVIEVLVLLFAFKSIKNLNIMLRFFNAEDGT